MPFFQEAKVLLIHIPKTGGSSIEDYFLEKTHERCTFHTLLSRSDKVRINNHTPQHCTFQELYDKKEYLELDIDNIMIIAAVRNPYHRIISDMFFFHILELTDTPDIVERKMKEFLQSSNSYDNHKRKQIDYVTLNGSIYDKIKILKTESLKLDMEKIGFSDFNVISNTTHRDRIDYMEYFNRSTLDLVNSQYSEDFDNFGYNKI